MHSNVNLILYGLILDLLVTQGAIITAVKFPSTASISCAALCLLTVLGLTRLLLQNISELKSVHYHIFCPPLSKQNMPKPIDSSAAKQAEAELNLLFRPTFRR